MSFEIDTMWNRIWKILSSSSLPESITSNRLERISFFQIKWVVATFSGIIKHCYPLFLFHHIQCIRFLSFISSLLLSLLPALYPSAALSRCRPPNLCERATSRLRERKRKRKRKPERERLAKRKGWEGEEREREPAFSSRQTAPGRCKGEGVRSWKISMYPSWRHDVSLNLALRVWSAAPPPG